MSNTVKISYSCMTNLKQNIDGHNKSTLHKKIVPSKTCNCRKPADCPLAGNCLKESVVYQATVATVDNRPDQTYVGLTENSFKTRFTNHKASFNHPSKKLNTELSKYIWQLKDTKTNFQITWKILKQAAPYNPASNRCNLCLWEKYFINQSINHFICPFQSNYIYHRSLNYPWAGALSKPFGALRGEPLIKLTILKFCNYTWL